MAHTRSIARPKPNPATFPFFARIKNHARNLKKKASKKYADAKTWMQTPKHLYPLRKKIDFRGHIPAESLEIIDELIRQEKVPGNEEFFKGALPFVLGENPKIEHFKAIKALFNIPTAELKKEWVNGLFHKFYLELREKTSPQELFQKWKIILTEILPQIKGFRKNLFDVHFGKTVSNTPTAQHYKEIVRILKQIPGKRNKTYFLLNDLADALIQKPSTAKLRVISHELLPRIPKKLKGGAFSALIPKLLELKYSDKTLEMIGQNILGSIPQEKIESFIKKDFPKLLEENPTPIQIRTIGIVFSRFNFPEHRNLLVYGLKESLKYKLSPKKMVETWDAITKSVFPNLPESKKNYFMEYNLPEILKITQNPFHLSLIGKTIPIINPELLSYFIAGPVASALKQKIWAGKFGDAIKTAAEALPEIERKMEKIASANTKVSKKGQRELEIKYSGDFLNNLISELLKHKHQPKDIKEITIILTELVPTLMKEVEKQTIQGYVDMHRISEEQAKSMLEQSSTMRAVFSWLAEILKENPSQQDLAIWAKKEFNVNIKTIGVKRK